MRPQYNQKASIQKAAISTRFPVRYYSTCTILSVPATGYYQSGACWDAGVPPGCSKDHAGAQSTQKKHKKCEDCGLKQPSYGLPSEQGKKRWCVGCSKEHAQALVAVEAVEAIEKLF